MRRSIVFFCCLMALVLCTLVCSHAASYRVDGNLIRVGDTVYEMLRHAGKPDRAVLLRPGDSTSVSVTIHSKGSKSVSSKQHDQSRTVVYYYYDSNRAIMLYVQDEIIVRIDRERM